MASIDTAIVTEGGGQRGIYTAGVLDTFLAEQFNPFNIGCGVSAGAQNLLTYYLRQPGYAKRAILELTAADDFLVPYRWMAARNIIDLDGYFERTLRDPDYWLPYQGVNDVQRLNTLQFVATDKHSLEPIYLQPDELSVISSLKASCAVPILYKSGVRFGERKSPLRSRVFSSRSDALLADYEQGRRDGQSAIHELKHWLEPLSS